MKSQNAQIKQYLESGRTLTALDALHRFGCFRLAARIQDLEDEGMDIDVEDVKITSHGKTKTFSRYKIKK